MYFIFLDFWTHIFLELVARLPCMHQLDQFVIRLIAAKNTKYFETKKIIGKKYIRILHLTLVMGKMLMLPADVDKILLRLKRSFFSLCLIIDSCNADFIFFFHRNLFKEVGKKKNVKICFIHLSLSLLMQLFNYQYSIVGKSRTLLMM